MKARQRTSFRKRAPQRQVQGLWQRGRLWFIGGGIAGAVALLVVFTSVLSGPEITTGGEPAPDMVLDTANGEFQLSDQRGEVSLLYFSFPG